MATLLEVVQDFCLLKAIPSPTTVLGSIDPQVLQIAALLQRGGKDLAQRGRWERLISEATWTTLAAEDQGAIATLAPGLSDGYILPETLWDRTDQLPLLGPTPPDEWQAMKAIIITGPRYSFRIRGGRFLSIPAPPAGHTWAFEYIDDRWLLDNDGTTRKRKFTEDTDEILLPPNVVDAMLLWMWKKEKGLDYAEDFRTAERLTLNSLGRSGMKENICMDEVREGPKPGIFIPAGTWNL